MNSEEIIGNLKTNDEMHGEVESSWLDKFLSKEGKLKCKFIRE